MIRKAIIAAASLLASLSLAYAPAAAANLNIKDGSGTAQVLCAKVLTDGSLAECHVMLDTTLAPIDPATKQYQVSILNALGSPFQAGGAIGNTSFGISGLLPAFATTPTVNLGTLNGVALDATLQAIKALLGAAPAQAGGKIDTVISSASVDRGAVLTTASMAVTLMPANAARRGLSLGNQSSGNCWFNGVATATADYHSTLLPALTLYESKDSHVGNGAISVICTAANASVSAREW